MLVRWGVVGLTCLIKPVKVNRWPLRHLNQLKHLMAIRSKPKLLVVRCFRRGRAAKSKFCTAGFGT